MSKNQEETPVIDSKSLENSTDDDVPDYCQVVHFTDCKGQTRKVLFPKGLDLDRPKRSRTSFNQWQLDALEREFLRCHGYVVGNDRTNLSKTLGLTETQVKVWFQNRRTKFKKDSDGKAEFNKQSKNLLSQSRNDKETFSASVPSSLTSQLGLTPPSLPPQPSTLFVHNFHHQPHKPPSIYIPIPTYKDYIPSVARNSYYNQFS